VLIPPLISGFPTNSSIFKFLGRDGIFLGTWLFWGLSWHLGVVFTIGLSSQAYRLKFTETGKITRFIFEWFQAGNNAKHFLNCSLAVNLISFLVGCAVARTEQIDVNSIPELSEVVEKHPTFVAINILNNTFLITFAIVMIGILCLEAAYCVKTNFVTFRGRF
jgi:hypothetical protein